MSNTAQFRSILVHLLLLGCAGQALAEAPAPVTRGHARFSVLSPTLVRLEYSPATKFVDELSISVIDRDHWPAAAGTSEEADGWLSLRTDKLTVHYKLDSGPFDGQNLRITWTDATGERSWKPGDKDDKNLGGVPGDMAGRVTPVTDPGPLSRNGYFLLDDSRTALRDKDTQWVKPRPEKESQDWYFFVYGNDYARMLGQMSRLLGSIPMPPRYVFGGWFGSRAGYSDHQWKMILGQFREESLPLDVTVLDSDSTVKVIWAGRDWDREQMPDPQEFFHWMRQRGIKVTVNEHYGGLTRENEGNFETIRQQLGLPADTKEIPHDLANKKYAELFMNLLHKPALDMGLAFWWQDGCAGANLNGLDPMEWTREVEYLGSERITGKRTFIFCRLGVWGSHRYGAYFSGDLPGEWACLNVIVPATQQAGNMLVAYINNLCGGVGNVDLPPELYQRWVQFGAFSPIIWFHGLWGLRLPWEYGPEGVETYRKFVGLRYALIPYTYTCARVAHETGLPLVRGMYLEFPDQEPAYSHPHQFMFGRELLVAPVTEPASGKPALKKVFLPGGVDWFDYFTGDIYRGGQTITHECPLTRMPLFVRAGSILPMAPEMDYSDQKPVDPLTLDVYGPAPASFRLYEDDGTSLDYRHGAYAWTGIAFKAAGDPGSYELTIEPAEGAFQGRLQRREYVVRLHGLLKPEAVRLNGRSLAELDKDGCGEGWSWEPRSRVAAIRVTHPLSTQATVRLSVEGAGTFADARVLQAALNLRAQVRQIKRELKLKHVSLTGGADIKKPPRVIRETETVEEALDQVVAEPRGRGLTPPDFEALRQHVLGALADQPFESNRTVPEIDPDAKATTEKIRDGKFTPAEVAKITGMLLGAELPARGLSKE
jgi:hypothetical protein